METLAKIYEDKYVLGYVRTKVSEIYTEITNLDLVETRIFQQLEKYYSLDTPRSLRRIKYLVDREIASAKKLYKPQNSKLFTDMEEYEVNSFEDIHVNPEKKIVEQDALQRKINAISTCEEETYVLNAWAEGCKDVEIAQEIADKFGGNPKSRRIWVQRFKKKCQQRLQAHEA